ncbi:HTH-type transcriptional regulator CynR [Paraburkholderia hiiakae]|uniref:HTH-type transcriptional regulator CynR n=1 Tax=Paraburkholderia hiiakae TaxID=1081782 RepID=A0ABM8NZH8_9BURK|nr:LysR family transcriptional regulator [Paraburkholderia hiiakae]CAD6550697.1 HTH-type transcriptional regulator CynR [Paraburkholderia hiiakae]
MDMRALRYFVEVVRQNGFRRASATLHVTQPAISRAIGQLEEEFELNFLVREPRGVCLTPEGDVLYRRASLILQQADSLASELRDLRSMVSGTLRVGLPPMTGSTFFGDVITEFRRQYPGVQLQIIEYGSNQFAGALSDGHVEIAAAMLPIEGEGFLTQTFARERLALLCSRDHRLAARKKVTLRELSDETFVAFTSDFKVNNLIDRLCNQEGFEPSVSGRSSHLDLLVSMVTSGMGVALLPVTVCRGIRSSRLRVVTVIDPVISFDQALVRHRDTYLSRSARAWIEIASEVLGFHVDPVFVA